MGFYLLPGAVRTYAPAGRTPVLRVPLSHDHLSAISAITPGGRLLMAVQPRSLRGPDVVRFLRHLLRHLSGALLVLWDGSPIHRAQAVKDFLAGGAGARLHLAQLPAYAVFASLERAFRRSRCVAPGGLDGLGDFPELRGFAGGLRRDIAAVTASLEWEWSNGQTEGQVNGPTLLKRATYGRAEDDLLRLRLLHAAYPTRDDASRTPESQLS